LWREENRRTRRKTLGGRTRTNNKLNPLVTPAYIDWLNCAEERELIKIVVVVAEKA